jgi:hypothetical protein
VGGLANVDLIAYGHVDNGRQGWIKERVRICAVSKEVLKDCIPVIDKYIWTADVQL